MDPFVERPEVLAGLHPLNPCRNPLCDRLTTAVYCCPACATAHDGGYEIHEEGSLAHGEDCDRRYLARGPAPGRPRLSRPPTDAEHYVAIAIFNAGGPLSVEVARAAIRWAGGEDQLGNLDRGVPAVRDLAERFVRSGGCPPREGRRP